MRGTTTKADALKGAQTEVTSAIKGRSGEADEEEAAMGTSDPSNN
jgi:hypothetical protein